MYRYRYSPALFVLGYTYIIFQTPVLSQNSGFCVDHGYTPENGGRTPRALLGYQYLPGMVIRYYCDEHYELRPNAPMQKCWSNQTNLHVWMPETSPECVELPVCSKPVILHATVDKEVYHEGDLMTVACDKGYTEVATESAVCLNNSKWSYVPSCKENDCLVPPSIEHGLYKFFPRDADYVGGIVSPGSIVFYYCDSGYQQEPSSHGPRECREGSWTGSEPKCVKFGCDPPDLALGEYLPHQPHYRVHETVTYLCHPDNDVIRSCQPDRTWSGTPCPGTLTTKQMPRTPSNVYCAVPTQPFIHGTYKCCTDVEVTSGDVTRKRGFCCPERDLVEFVCDPGYSLIGDPVQWICGGDGEWLIIDANHLGATLEPPKCYGNDTRADQGLLTDEMLKPVIGVAASVLVALSAAIVIALCRPKLIDMKRRWRKLREDEDELIIDGRRILLPSYDEAITTRDPCLPISDEGAASSSSNPRDDVPGPSQPYPQSEPSVQRSRSSYSSDEEMLVPELRSNRIEGASRSRPQSLVLKASTSVDSCVVINQSLKRGSRVTTNVRNNCEELVGDPMCSQHDVIESHTTENLRSKRKKNFIYDPILSRRDSSVRNLLAAENFSTSLEMESDEPMLDIGANFDCNLGSIHPQALGPQPKTWPVILEGGYDILNYPLIPVPCDAESGEDRQQSFSVHTDPLESDNGPSVENEMALVAAGISTDSSRPMSLPQSNCEESDESSEQRQQVSQDSNDYDVVAMSLQTTKYQRLQDEMGSTAV